MGDESKNGHVFALASELERVERKVDARQDDNNRIHSRLETAEINLGARLGDINRALRALQTDLNESRLTSDLRFDRLDAVLRSICQAVGVK